jgi:hypothetical protein
VYIPGDKKGDKDIFLSFKGSPLSRQYKSNSLPTLALLLQMQTPSDASRLPRVVFRRQYTKLVPTEAENGDWQLVQFIAINQTPHPLAVQLNKPTCGEMTPLRRMHMRLKTSPHCGTYYAGTIVPPGQMTKIGAFVRVAKTRHSVGHMPPAVIHQGNYPIEMFSATMIDGIMHLQPKIKLALHVEFDGLVDPHYYNLEFVTNDFPFHIHLNAAAD